jgi:uncharacterized protein YcbK (DUF882 family)
MQLTKNLSRSELTCKCGCGFNAADIVLVGLLQDACNHFKEKYASYTAMLIVTSGNRCQKHNADEGGATSSQHIQGIAADHKVRVVIDGELVVVAAEELAGYYDDRYPDSLGIGMYPRGRVHLDVRSFPARWDNR